MVQGVLSDNPASQLEATTQFRKLLSIGMYAVLRTQYCRQSQIATSFKLLAAILCLCRAVSSNWGGYQSWCCSSICRISWQTRSTSTAGMGQGLLFSPFHLILLNSKLFTLVTTTFFFSLRQLGHWLILHLVPRSTQELWLIMELSRSLCNFCPLLVMMFENRLVLESEFFLFPPLLFLKSKSYNIWWWWYSVESR